MPGRQPGAIRESEEGKGDIIYDEIQVYGGIAERTGTRLDRANVRGRRGVCRSVTQLGAMARRLGDGYYYLASSAWPPDQAHVDLNRSWVALSS